MSKKRSPEIEEYLEAIYRKEENGQAAKTNELAKELGITPASVSEMLRKLATDGLVEYFPYRKIKLMKKGREIGKKITKTHRLIEKFLVLLGVKKNLHEEACVLEHTISDDVERAMEKAVKERNVRSLRDMRKNECGKIVLIVGGWAAKKRLEEMGLTPDTRIKVERLSALGCPMEIKVRGSRLAIGCGLATKVFVKRCM